MADLSVDQPAAKKAVVRAPSDVVIPKTIAAALIEIQSELRPMAKSAANESFNSNYVPLEDVMSKAFEVLSKHKIGVTQSPIDNADGQASLETTLFTGSGQGYTRVAKLAMTERAATPQGHGSAITYMRRYALMAMLGLTGQGDDDDGNKATGVVVPVSDEQVARIRSLCMSMKFPPKDIEQQIFNVKTRDHADLTIQNLESMVSMRRRETEASENAAAVESDHEGTKIMVGTSEIEAPLGEVDPRSEMGFKKRLADLKLAGPEYERRLLISATKAYSFVSIMKDDEKVASLDNYLKTLESEVHALPAEFYAPTDEPRTVEEDVA